MSGLGFCIESLWFRVKGINFRFRDLGYWVFVLCLGRVSNFGFRVSVCEFRVPGFGLRVWGLRLNRFEVCGLRVQVWGFMAG